MKKLINMTAGILLATTAMNAMAKDEEKPLDDKTAALPTFSKIDSDSDGFISLEESKSLSNLVAQFGNLDADGDQRLSRVEFLKFRISK